MQQFSFLLASILLWTGSAGAQEFKAILSSDVFTLVGQAPAKLLIPSRPEEAARLLRAEVNHIFQATRQVILSSADVRQRYRDLQAERTRLLGMDKNDSAYASAARDNNALWTGLSQHINKHVSHWRKALRRARANPSHPSLKGADAELAWMQKWGHLPEWDMLMEAWMLSREADEEATAVLALSMPPALPIPEMQPPQPVTLLELLSGSEWKRGNIHYVLEAGGALRVGMTCHNGKPPTDCSWTVDGEEVVLRYTCERNHPGGAWFENVIRARVAGDAMTGTLTSIPHSSTIGVLSFPFSATRGRR